MRRIRSTSRSRAAVFVEYLLLVGAIGLVSVAVAVKYDGQLRDQFQREISSTAKKGPRAARPPQ